MSHSSFVPVVLLVGACGGAGANVAPGSKDVHLIGRFDVAEAAGARFSFSGSRLVTRFDGTGLSVRLDEAAPNQYSVRVDGQEQPVLKTEPGEKLYPLVSGLAAGVHDLVLTRRTEAFFGVTRWVGFEGAPLVVSPPPYQRFIELVGDSITCGYGVLGEAPTCAFGPDTESEPDAYGALAAEELGAAHASIAYSGKGVFQNYGGAAEALMPEVYGRTFGDSAEPAWDFAGYSPDAVVVNLGTNDYWDGDPGDGFSAAYDAFVKELRARHPSAWIVLVLSPMLSDGFPEGKQARTHARARLEALVQAARTRGDARVDFLELEEQSEIDGLGCDYHPGKLTQAKMAKVLVERLRSLLRW